ncbi:amino acid ABC transporter permease [Aminobacter carboxidus]|uniref:Glutamate/aspartate import permease protein GltK n=1 Tax=Aminobacter carboxidus TaxID=376165 RepID=A0A8E1WJC2_9HYPH|nr:MULTISPECIES: amino acid ABC transporter permease [Aminobacter carboxidus group]MBB6469548.1 polar amino acid transport system permease protein [Aminobacter lissarensis]MBE1208510.1 amino acid ABC transporter permease [Aminobacter carboxidus]
MSNLNSKRPGQDRVGPAVMHFVRRPGEEPATQDAPFHAKQRTRYGQIVSALIVIALLSMFAASQATNPNMEWGVSAAFLFHPVILGGVGVTLQLAVLAMLISIVLALFIALMIQSQNKVASVIGRVYVWFFRGVPMLVQVLLWYNLAVLFPTIFGYSTNNLISGFSAGLIALSLAESGYMAEIIRGGMISVPAGQIDAGMSLGLTRGQALLRIVLPQSIRVIIPPTGNQFIGMLKATSLVSVIGGSDLLTRTQLIYGQNFKILPLLIVAVLWYLILVTVASIGQHFLEKRFNASQPGSRQARKNRQRPGNAQTIVAVSGVRT